MASEDANVRRVILLGSLATSRATAASDADILVVLAHAHVPLPHRPVHYAGHLHDTGLPAELLVSTDEEIRGDA